MRLSLNEISRTPIINIFLNKTPNDAMKMNKIILENQFSIVVTVIVFLSRLTTIERV